MVSQGDWICNCTDSTPKKPYHVLQPSSDNTIKEAPQSLWGFTDTGCVAKDYTHRDLSLSR
ncbi:hypothetical protein CY34DRAFT_799674 [Suillus luteus UH-Slu-Lm8-n1]|uniref:Uncharacterized protein n=1 Tax=Suillus luteus UH-Slu-Lm8-n1 TaxID=930992 RepID=A0A0D0BBM0_9AGAM|nr:hypothetical protein CY34DRAFT_799674 [Suillus luteus UH-Slu-Lm8-n1]